MSVVIRLRRMGAKKDPKFRIVVAESKSPRDGRCVDELGSYNPQPKEAELRVDAERAKYWLSVGASPSDQVKSLFKKAGIPLPVRATKPKKKAEAKKAEAKKAKQAKGPTKRVQAKKARVAAKAATPTRKPAKKATKKAAAK